MARVFVAGLAAVDFIFQVDELPSRGEKYRANDAIMVGGGGAANAAVAIARLGGEASLAARIGTDQIADQILHDLRLEGVDTALVHRAEGGISSFSSVTIDRDGARQVVNFRGADLAETADWLGNGPETDAVLADNRWPKLTATALRLARRQGIPGIVDAEDPVDPECLKEATHIAFSAPGMINLTGEENLSAGLQAAARKLPGWICVTDGRNGVFYLDGRSVENQPAPEVEVIDTLAAGDVWHGAFALRLAEGADEPDAIMFANAAASLKCMHFGGRTACPIRETVETFLRDSAPPG